MRIKTEITQEDFSRLLNWLASEAEEAAQKYEQIRIGLIRFFRYRGCDEGETLADETINRVAKKLATINFDGKVKVITYFYAFASRIYLEHRKEERKIAEKSREIAALYERSTETIAEPVAGVECLERCLAARPTKERTFLIAYYAGEKNAAHRKELADREGISLINLHTRASRMRANVGKCIRNCLNGA